MHIYIYCKRMLRQDADGALVFSSPNIVKNTTWHLRFSTRTASTASSVLLKSVCQPICFCTNVCNEHIKHFLAVNSLKVDAVVPAWLFCKIADPFATMNGLESFLCLKFVFSSGLAFNGYEQQSSSRFFNPLFACRGLKQIYSLSFLPVDFVSL